MTVPQPLPSPVGTARTTWLASPRSDLVFPSTQPLYMKKDFEAVSPCLVTVT